MPCESEAVKIVVFEKNRILRESLTTLISTELNVFVQACNSLPESSEPTVEIVLTSCLNERKLRIEDLQAAFPRARVLAMNANPDEIDFSFCFGGNIAGFLTEDAGTSEILSAIKAVANGNTAIPPTIAAAMLKQLSARNEIGTSAKLVNKLTLRERQIAHFVVQGLSNKEIADDLNISIDTVKSHVHNILDKLQLQNRIKLVQYCSNEGLVSVDRGGLKFL